MKTFTAYFADGTTITAKYGEKLDGREIKNRLHLNNYICLNALGKKYGRLLEIKEEDTTTRMTSTKVEDLRTFLRNTDLDDILLRTSYVAGGWHDNEFDAHRAGFNIYRTHDQELADRHEFADCYHLVRMN